MAVELLRAPGPSAGGAGERSPRLAPVLGQVVAGCKNRWRGSIGDGQR